MSVGTSRRKFLKYSFLFGGGLVLESGCSVSDLNPFGDDEKTKDFFGNSNLNFDGTIKDLEKPIKFLILYEGVYITVPVDESHLTSDQLPFGFLPIQYVEIEKDWNSRFKINLEDKLLHIPTKVLVGDGKKPASYVRNRITHAVLEKLKSFDNYLLNFDRSELKTDLISPNLDKYSTSQISFFDTNYRCIYAKERGMAPFCLVPTVGLRESLANEKRVKFVNDEKIFLPKAIEYNSLVGKKGKGPSISSTQKSFG